MLFVKVTVMKIGVINVTMLLPPTMILHVSVWFSLKTNSDPKMGGKEVILWCPKSVAIV